MNNLGRIGTASNRKKIAIGAMVLSILGLFGLLNKLAIAGLHRVVPLLNLGMTYWELIAGLVMVWTLYCFWIGSIR